MSIQYLPTFPTNLFVSLTSVLPSPVTHSKTIFILESLHLLSLLSGVSLLESSQ